MRKNVFRMKMLGGHFFWFMVSVAEKSVIEK